MSTIAIPRSTTSLQISLPVSGCDCGTVQGLQFMARELAQFLDLSHIYMAYEDQLEGEVRDAFYLPAQTLNLDQAKRLGIHCAAQLYGGVVPHDFLAYKTVAHPLAQSDMDRPAGWNNDLAKALGPTVLPGYSAFSIPDALRAMSLLDQAGHTGIRIKLARASAGEGQRVVYSRQQLEELLALPPWQEQVEHGLVLEENLLESQTFSVGQTQIGEHLFSYIGQQHQTNNRQQESVYGGTTLLMVRGRFDALLQLSGMQRIQYLIDLAMNYESRITQAYPSLYASRRNYDVIVGHDARGNYQAAVLEHSWRCGGASIAEILAMRSLQNHPEQGHTHAWTRERYMDDPDPVRQSPHLYSLQQLGNGYLARFGGPLSS